MIKNIFIDLDYTLIQNPIRFTILPMIADDISKKTGIKDTEIIDRVFEINRHRISENTLPASQIMDWDDILIQLLKSLQVKYKSSIRELVEEHNKPPYSYVFPGARQLLVDLHNMQIKIIGSTMGLSKYQIPVLKGLQLLELFDEIITPDTSGYLKIKRLFYKRYLDPMQLANSTTLGDKYRDDVLVPKGIGFRSIWKPKPNIIKSLNFDNNRTNPIERPMQLDKDLYPVLPDAVVLGFDEIMPVIEQL